MTDHRVAIQEIELANGYRLGRITLDNPRALNALRLDMIEHIQQAITAWEADPTLACILIDANSDKAFCAGGDIVSLYRSISGEGEPDYPERFFVNEYRLCHDLHRLSTPVIAWGHGVVMGGGLGLFESASHRVVTETARLAMPEIRIGLFPDVAGTWFFNRMPRYLALFVALTGATLDAADALFTGLATHARTHESKATLLAALVAQRDWQAPHATVANALDAMPLDSIAARPASAPIIEHLDTLFEATRGPTLAAIGQRIAALADHPSPWLSAAAHSLAGGCPVTAHLIHRQIDNGRYLSLADGTRRELAMALQCCAHPDFAEGVRALLIDKDKRPNWHFQSIAEVPADYVDRHFTPTWEGPHPLADLG